MKLKVITELEKLNAHREQWNSVAGHRAFFRFEWMVKWFEEMRSEGDSPHVIVAIDDTQEDETWLAIAPFFVSARKLRFLASGSACTDYCSIFSTLDLESHQKFCVTVAEYLEAQLAPGEPLEDVDCVELEGCGKADQELDFFCTHLEERGFTPHETETEGAWKVLLPDSFAQLNATFSKSMRRKTKAAIRRMAEPETDVVFATPDTFDTLWRQLEVLHQKRRAFLGQPGCFADDQFARFLAASTKALFEAELATLIVIYRNQTPISAVILFHFENTCMMYQSGLDPEFSALEPGYQTNCAAVDFAINAGFKYFDFLRGDEPYKARWSTSREAIIRRKFVPKKFSAQVKHGTWVIGRSIKNYITGIGHMPNTGTH